MRALVVTAVLCLLPAMAADAWRPLFNGRNLDGWAAAGSGRPAFTVEDGAIREPSGRGLLWYSREKIGNGTLRVIYRISDAQGDAGVVIRIPAAPSSDEPGTQQGMEAEMDDRESGALRNLGKALCYAAKPTGEWNTMDITIAGPRTTVKLNGALVSDYQGPSAEPGYVALRHGLDSSVLTVREVSLLQ